MITQGRMQDFSGGGGNLFLIHMPRAAKLRAVARGVWGYGPSRKFLKMMRFESNHFHDKKSS